MDEVWKGRFYTIPFLYVGTWRRIMFPETGSNIPFTIENYAFVDQFGRETVSWIRTFQISSNPAVRRLHDLQRRSTAGSSTISARTSIWPSTSISRSMMREVSAFVPAPSGSMKA